MSQLLQKMLDYYWRDGGRFSESLHSVIEDGNLENITLDTTIKDFERCLVLLKTMRLETYETRWEAYEAFWKDFDETKHTRMLADLKTPE